MEKKSKVKMLTRFSLLLAIEALVCFTPLGSLPGPNAIVWTLALIPVVVTAVSMGTMAGSLMGLFAGLFSLIVWTFMPPSPVVAFVFSPFARFGDVGGNVLSLVISVVPRVLVGTVTGLVFRITHKQGQSRGKEVFSYCISGVLGSLTNTVLVLGGIFLFFGEAYAQALGISQTVLVTIILSTVLTNGIPEAVLAGIGSIFIGRAIKSAIK